MGRKKTTEGTRKLGIRVEKSTHTWIGQRAMQLGITRRELMRRILNFAKKRVNQEPDMDSDLTLSAVETQDAVKQ